MVLLIPRPRTRKKAKLSDEHMKGSTSKLWWAFFLPDNTQKTNPRYIFLSSEVSCVQIVHIRALCNIVLLVYKRGLCEESDHQKKIERQNPDLVDKTRHVADERIQFAFQNFLCLKPTKRTSHQTMTGLSTCSTFNQDFLEQCSNRCEVI